MSRIGRIPIDIPSAVTLRIEGSVLKAKGPQGEQEELLPSMVRAEIRDGKVFVSVPSDHSRHARAMHGTTRARLANLISGVHVGFTKVLEIVGLGYKAQLSGEKIILNLGRSHPVELLIPKGVKVSVDPKSTQVTVAGSSRELVGATAAAIRALKPPEPYKGVGIRYQGEHIRRKAGKTAAGAGAGGAAGGAKK